MNKIRNLNIEILGSESSTRDCRQFRKTRSTWGIIESDFGPIGYESNFEQNFVLMMLADPQTTNIIHQPLAIRFRIAGTSSKRRYTPDYLVERDLKKPWIWGKSESVFEASTLTEIKPLSKLSTNDNRLFERLEAGHKWANQHETDFRVIGEKFITSIAVGNALSVIAALSVPFPSWIKNRPVLLAPMALIEVFEACTVGVGKECLAHFFYFGFAKRWFWCPLNLKITLTNTVYPY
jgi:hypothetical protein